MKNLLSTIEVKKIASVSESLAGLYDTCKTENFILFIGVYYSEASGNVFRISLGKRTSETSREIYVPLHYNTEIIVELAVAFYEIVKHEWKVEQDQYLLDPNY